MDETRGDDAPEVCTEVVVELETEELSKRPRVVYGPRRDGTKKRRLWTHKKKG